MVKEYQRNVITKRGNFMKNILTNKKIFFTFLFAVLSLFITFNSVFAVTAYPYKSIISQPDGTNFNAYFKGDEYFSYYIDENNNVIVKDDEDNTWKYVINENDKLALGSNVAVNAKNIKSSKDKNIKASVFKNDTKKKEYLKLQEKNSTLRKRETPDPIDLSKVPISKSSKTYKGLKDKNSTTRELPMVIIDVSFQDIETENTEKWYDTIYNDPNGIIAYYKEVSNDKFTVAPVKETNTTHPGTIKVKLDRNHGNRGADFVSDDFDKAIQESLTKAGSTINFKDYDINKNGKIYNNELAVVIIFAGYEAAVPDPAEPNFWASQTTYWEPYLNANDTYIMNFVGFAEKLKQTTSPDEAMNGISTLCHELGHYIGLPDLYDVDYDAGVWFDFANVEYLSLMDGGNWAFEKHEGYVKTKYIPSHLDALSKWMLGYYDESYINKSGEYTLHTASDKDKYNFYIIPTNDANKYFIIENRQFKNFDRVLGSSYKATYGLDRCDPGIVIYRVDSKIIYENYNTNTVNSSYHSPGLSVIKPFGTTHSFPSPMWSDFIYNLNDPENFEKVPYMGMLGREPGYRTDTGIKIDTNISSSDEMTIKVELPNAKVSSIKAKNPDLNNKGGKVSFSVKGKNFYGDMTLSVFDKNGNKINEDWANKVIKNEDVYNITTRNAAINFPENATKVNKNYFVKASFNNGKTYDKVASNLTVKTSYKKQENSNSDKSNISINKNSKSPNSAKTSDEENMNVWFIILSISVLGVIGIGFKLRRNA